MILNSIKTSAEDQQGNMLIIILIAIVLIGALTAAIQGTSSHNATIDKETIILQASEVRQYSSEIERAVTYIMQNGISESDLRFAHPLADSSYGNLDTDTDRSDQVFAKEGGGAQYKAPPDGINNGDAWEFYVHTALPDVGSDKAELIAVLPNVTQDFCAVINAQIGYTGQPLDSSTCINGSSSDRVNDAIQFASTPNTTEENSFSQTPAKMGCIKCTTDNSYHYFHVLISR